MCHVLNRYIVKFACLSSLLFGSPLWALSDSSSVIESRLAVLSEISQRIQTELFDPSLAPDYLARLSEISSQSDLTKPLDSDEFALRIHWALQAVQADGHLSIYGPQRTQNLLGQFYTDEDEVSESGRTSDAPPPFSVTHHNVADGYAAIISMTGFADSDEIAAELNATMGALPPGTPLIFDLRGNRGGNARHFRLLSGCLFSETTPVHAIRWRDGDGFRTIVRHSEPDPVCSHHANSPIYVLVDHQTASTAELMPFILQARRRAVIVGETTYGASHAAEFYELPGEYSMMIPIGATYDPVTGGDWDGVGVIPDIAVKSDRALEAALVHYSGQVLCARLAPSMPGFTCETDIPEE